MPKGYFIPLTKTQEQKIEREFLKKPIKRLARELGIAHGRVMRFLQKKGLEIPADLVLKRKLDSRKQKGDIPHNKGKKQVDYMTKQAIEISKKSRFQKGNSPHNTKYNGHERVTKDGYTEIRLSERNYRLKHLVNWEKINGKLPKGFLLSCIDGNRQNTAVDNWILISRAENMLKNSIHNFSKEIIPSLVLVNKINKQINSLQDG